MNRRIFLSLSSALVLPSAIAANVEPTKSNKSQVSKNTYVLVHGAWHGGWCWREVKAILQAAGHAVYTPTLTGLGEREHLNSRDINLSTHVQDITNLIKYEELQNVILVGHSYAGYVVSLVADAIKDKLAKVIYLDAALPKEGRAFFSDEIMASMKEKYGGDFVLPVPKMDFLGIPEDHPKADWVKRQLTPHPLGPFFEPVVYRNEGASGVPKFFIRCTETRTFKSGDTEVKAIVKDNPEWQYDTIETGHDAMVTEPTLLAEMLLSATNG